MAEKQTQYLISAGPEGWIAWQCAEDGTWTESERLPMESKPWDFSLTKSPWIFCPSVRSMQTMAIRVPTGKDTDLNEVLPLRIEAAGLDAGEDGVVLTDWKVVAQASESRTVMVWAVDPNILDGCPANRLPYLVVPGMARWKWAAKELHLWSEGGRWIAAFTGENFPVHLQPSAGTENVEAMADDLRGQANTLLLRGLVSMPVKIVTRGGGAVFAQELGQLMGLPVAEATEFPQILPTESRIVTKEMLAARKAKEEAKRWKQRLAIVAVLWIGAAAYGGVRYFTTKSALDAARLQHAQVMPKDESLKKIQGEWDNILMVNGVEAFPLEVLARLFKTMPPSDFRLTTFTVEGDKDIYLKGSAKRPDLALKFAQDLRRDKELSDYQWETPYPVNEKDGTATFTYQGKFRTNIQ